MTDKFWDIDDVLAEQQKIPCFVSLDIPGYGFLDGNSSENLAKNTRVEMPFWLVYPMTVADSVEIEIPACFSKRVTDDLSTSAKSVNLNGLCPCFFYFGIKFVNLIEGIALGKVLAEAFSERLAEIMRYSQSGRSYSKFISFLDDTEKQIFQIGRESAHLMQMWSNGLCNNDKIQAARVLKKTNVKM
ncbi:GINS complex, Psf3 component [Rhizoclosmatium globosum]|uniref:DNA replication complex GINS protein PSF3 n=1 Tax=Rhizoclosmatium globosum TaxID=329046 RepID=A0A1Y2D196_9FUNG|nr:DNA replication protein [Rhizoclosmatium sp. JEL0117]ORY52375.1 GINS complex, Psf3 component [Rhizoclosmatium globosum]|eukprot:ORY52375.1 GINS complex, Psf3 component [Rhizoclosmatium globosum]